MDTISLPIDIDPSKIDSRFRLVIVAAQRARQIMEGAEPAISVQPNHKETTVAIKEVLSGELEILYGEDAIVAQQEEKRLREEMKRRAMLAEREGELSNEIKKDLSIYLGETSKQDETPDKAPEENSDS